MTNYNDGNWWGWNGGECPVHPKTVVQAVWYSETGLAWTSGIRPAEVHDWSDKTIAFRVTKEHREPREWFIRIDENGNFAGHAMDWVNISGGQVVKVREVLDE